MIDQGKKNVLGIMVDAVDYEGTLARIGEAAKLRVPLSVSALAVHGVMTGHQSVDHRFRLNSFDVIAPDGQPVRWALNLMHRTKLKERVYGPSLTLQTLALAAEQRLPVYFYGATDAILAGLISKARELNPALIVAGSAPSAFRNLTVEEKVVVAETIADSGARILFVGLGCPRQEIFVYEMKGLLSMPLLAVGAAFAFIAGELPQAPSLMQRYGLEWLFRLLAEPSRLWRRYLLLNPYYAWLLAAQCMGRQFSPLGKKPDKDLLYG